MKLSSEIQQYQEPTKIWNISFVSIFFANMAMNLGQQMSNSLLAIYADSLGATAGAIGLLMSAFAVSALFFKIFSAPAMDTYNRKYLVIGAMLVLATSYVGFSFSNTMHSLMIFRLLQGMGMAFGNVCCLAMVAETLPKDKYGIGIGYYSLTQVVTQAIGPTIGLSLAGVFGYKITYLINMGVMLIAMVLAFKIKIYFKRTKKYRIVLNNIIAKEALMPAVVFLFVATGMAVINSFLIVFAAKQGVTANIGYYFMISALTMLITRPLVGKLSDKYGFVKVVIPSLILSALSLLIISNSHSLWMFLIAAFVNACGFGACQPAVQALTMKCATSERRGAASSTSYIANDIGNFAGAALGGVIAQSFGYAAMWRTMTIPLLFSVILLLVFRVKFNAIEKNFLVRTQNQQ